MALTDALWAWWWLGEKDGGRRDSCGNGRHLVDNGGVGSVPASVGAGAVFSGTPGQYLSLPSALPPGSFTVALWAQLLTITASPPSLWSQGMAGVSLQKLFAQGPNWRFATKDASGTWTPHGPVPAPWRHVAGVYDEDLQRITLYVDGLDHGHLDGEGLTTGGAVMALGANPDGTAENLRGTLALCGLWTRALSADEVAALWNGGAGIDYPFAA